MTSEIRFTTSADGTRIAYATFGSGPPLVEVPRWAQTIEWNDRDEEFGRFYEKLGAFRQVIIVERRGTGASQREVRDFSLDAHLADIDAVVAHARLDEFDLLGSGDGAAVSIAYSARNPDKVRQLVLFAAYGKYGSETQLAEATRRGVVTTAEAGLSFSEFVRHNWPTACRYIADTFFPNEPVATRKDIARWWCEWVSAEAAYKYLLFAWMVDVRHLLAEVECPTLVLHRHNDETGHFEVMGKEVAAGIPDSRFVPIPGDVGVHQYQHDQIVAEMRKFLGADESQKTPQGPFRTVLFTDLVGHTEMLSRLGDERGRAVLREHETITRNVLKMYGGTEVKTMGDGFMASFGSVTKAVECAIALQRAFAEREGEPLSVRVGLNAGEPIEEDGDLFGATVILASRIAAKAEGGEILVADTVRGLCSGKGFLFADRGDFVAKGFEEPVRVYEVKWRE
jgi:class 3 adenylate cyclase/pimeloyl-ACP methyl ester carboxylesterase